MSDIVFDEFSDYRQITIAQGHESGRPSDNQSIKDLQDDYFMTSYLSC